MFDVKCRIDNDNVYMDFEIYRGFRKHFYTVNFGYYHPLKYEAITCLKFAWVMQTISRNNHRWSSRSLRKFLDTLPTVFQIQSGCTMKRYIEIAKSNFVEALFFFTQENASVEGLTGRDTDNTSCNLGKNIYELRLQDIHDRSILWLLPNQKQPDVLRYKEHREKSPKDLGSDYWSQSSKLSSDTMQYFTNDPDFLIKMVLLLSTLEEENCNGEYDFCCFRDLDIYGLGHVNDFVKYGEMLMHDKFLCGVHDKYKNQALSHIRKITNAHRFLNSNLIYASVFQEKNRMDFYNPEIYQDIFFNNDIPVHYNDNDKIWHISCGEKVGVNSMIGASKLISKYADCFNPSDIDFLKHRKPYLGEKTSLSCIKNFGIFDSFRKKYSHPKDLNDPSLNDEV